MVSDAADAAGDAGDQPPVADRAVARVAARLRSFAVQHPGTRALIDYLGRDQTRIVLVCPSGTFGDAVVASVHDAEQACELAGVATGTWDRETSAQVDLTPAYRVRMAGTGR